MRMVNDDKNTGEWRMPGLVDRYLSSANDQALESVDHLDEDLLTAFVEGSLNEREAQAAVGHLAHCGFCRRSTVDLLRLDVAFESTAGLTSEPETPPVKVSEVLQSFLSRLSGFGNEAVLGHQESEPSDDKPDELTNTEK